LDTNLARLYENIGDLYKWNDLEKGKEYYLKLKDLSEKLNWNEGRLLFASEFCVLLGREGMLDSAIVILSHGIELAKKENNEKWIANLSIHSGQIYKFKQWYETALSYYLKALPILEKKNVQNELGFLYTMMSNLYRNLYLNDKAIEYGEKAHALLDDNPNALISLGAAHSAAKQYEKGNFYFEKGMEAATKINNQYIIQHIYLQLANNALNVGDLKNIELNLKKYFEICRIELEDNGKLAYYYLLGKLEEMKGNFQESEKLILMALDLAQMLDNYTFQKNCFGVLCELSVAQHKFLDNIHYSNEASLVEITFAQETAIRAAEEMAAKYETEKKQLEIENQHNIIQRQNLQRLVFLGCIAICMIFLFTLWYMIKRLSRSNSVLAEANAVKDKFFSIISHDLKNPAIAQRDAIQLLKKNGLKWEEEVLSLYYDELFLSAERNVELIYNLLNWAQMQTGRIVYMPTTFDIVASIKAEIAFVEEMAKNKEIALFLIMPEETLVTADRYMVATVIRNLLINAVKFTHKGGSITVEISNINRKSLKLKRISITDTGIGMSEEQLRDIFRLDKTHSSLGTANETGSGLGLITCKELLDKCDSILHIESEKGKGSKFWFDLI
jgi:signal transduction histidine kinase